MDASAVENLLSGLPVDPVFAIAAAIGVIVVIVAVLLLLLQGGAYPYEVEEGLLTRGEAPFHEALRKAVPDHLMICPKVRVGDVLRVRGRMSYKRWRAAFMPIACKHFDFVLARPGRAQPVVAVELDDRSHDRRDRRKRDQFIDNACAAAGIPLMRVPAARNYSAKALRAEIEQLMERGD